MKILSVRRGFLADHSSTSYEFLAIDRPKREMIEERLALRQRIFEAEDHTDRLTEKRRLALEVMDVLEEFDPYFFEEPVSRRLLAKRRFKRLGAAKVGGMLAFQLGD